MIKIIAIILLSIFMQGCTKFREYKLDRLDKITAGKVQREISVGMSGAQVAQVLGSPNIVSTDKDSNEVWIYDKISTNSVSSGNRVGADIWIFFFGASAASSSTTSSSAQKTLTIIIKFDKNNKVRDFSYRTSSF